VANPLIIDSREPASSINKVRAVLSPRWSIQQTVLRHGDYFFPVEGVIIERKTALDLLGSISDGRLTSQVLGMTATAKTSVVLVSGSLLPTSEGKVKADGRKTDWNWSSVQAQLLSAQRMGAYLVYTPTSQWIQTMEAAVDWASKKRRDSTEVIIRPKGDLLTRAAPQVEMMCMLPHIGPTMATRLWEFTGKSLACCLNVLTGGLTEVPRGIGPATIRDNIRFFGLEPDQYITIHCKENEDD
jgi:ERCC4-type nuclease